MSVFLIQDSKKTFIMKFFILLPLVAGIIGGIIGGREYKRYNRRQEKK